MKETKTIIQSPNTKAKIVDIIEDCIYEDYGYNGEGEQPFGNIDRHRAADEIIKFILSIITQKQ